MKAGVDARDWNEAADEKWLIQMVYTGCQIRADV